MARASPQDAPHDVGPLGPGKVGDVHFDERRFVRHAGPPASAISLSAVRRLDTNPYIDAARAYACAKSSFTASTGTSRRSPNLNDENLLLIQQGRVATTP